MLYNHCTKPASEQLPLTFSQRMSQFQRDHNYTAYIYATIASICLVILQVNMKIVSFYINPLHALAIRGFFLLLINSMIIQYSELTLNIKDRNIFIIMIKRIFWSAITVSMFLAPLKYIPNGTASAFFNTGPIIVCFVQAIKYDKPLNLKHLLLTMVSFMGILMVIQPDFLFGSVEGQSQKYKYFMLFSLASAFTNSISATYLHDLKGKVSTTIALHYFYIGQCFFNNLAMMFQQINYEATQFDIKFYACLTCLIISGYLCQNLNTRAIMIKKPSQIMPFGYITIVLASLIDYMYFQTQFNTLSIIGMLLTSSGLLVKVFVPENDRGKSQKVTTQENQLLDEDKQQI